MQHTLKEKDHIGPKISRWRLAQQLGTLASLPEGPRSIPSILMPAHMIRSPVPLWTFQALGTHTHRGQMLIHMKYFLN